MMKRHCASCFAQIDFVLVCPGCYYRTYCSKQCFTQDWKKSHHLWCRVNRGERDADWKITQTMDGEISIVALRDFAPLDRIMIDPMHTKSRFRPCPTTPPLEHRLHGVLSLQMTYARHSCNANSAHVFDLKANSVILVAKRHIAAGEEITINKTLYNEYWNVSMTPEISRVHLERYHDVICKQDCLCRSPACNNQIALTKQLYASIISGTSISCAISMLTRILGVVEKSDSSPITLARVFVQLAEFSSLIPKEMAAAKYYAQKAIDLYSKVYVCIESVPRFTELNEIMQRESRKVSASPLQNCLMVALPEETRFLEQIVT